MDPSRDDIVYFASVVDCEGSISCVVSTFYPSVHVGNNYKPLLDTMHELFSGTVTPGSGKVKICWRWSLRGTLIVPFLMLVEPFLRIKQRQARLAILLAGTIKAHGLHYSDEEALRRMYLSEKINAFNKEEFPWTSASSVPLVDSNVTQP